MTQTNLPSPEPSPDNHIWQRWAARWLQQQQLALLTRWQMLHLMRGRGPRWRRARRRLQQTAVALLLGSALLFSPLQPAHAAGAAFTEQTGAANPFDGVGMVHDNPTFTDIDNDGDPDAFLLFSEGETAVIRHFRNEGTPLAPLFVQQHNADNPFAGLSVDLLSSYLTFADLDNDGDQDAFMGDMNGRIVHYQNVGSPSAPLFAAPTYLPAAEGGTLDIGDFSAPFFVDIDGDGDLDLFVGEKGGNIRYYQNTGAPNAPLFPNSPLTNPFGLIDIGSNSKPIFADLDNDGDQDALMGAEDGNLHYFQNSGTATAPAFAPRVINPFGLTGVGASSRVTLTDIDGDGDLDAFVGSNSATSSYFRNTGSAAASAFTAQSAADHPINQAQDQSQPVLADIDQDGDLDAFVGVANGTVLYYRNSGTPLAATFSPQSGADNPLAGVRANTATALAFGDLDGDGDLDAFVRAADGIHYYRNSGTQMAPVFNADAAANPFNGLDTSAATSLTFADIDGDGDLDAFGGTADGAIHYYPNTGSATQPAFADGSVANPLAAVNVGAASVPTFADLDRDGDLDALIGAADGLFHAYQNTGTPIAPVFNAQTGAANPLNGLDVGQASAPAVGDMDGDGDIDLFSGTGDGRIAHYRNTGVNTTPTATFIPRSGIANPFNGLPVGNWSFPRFADVDGDGDIDAVIGNQNGNISYYQNTGTALAPVFTEQTGPANPFNGVDIGHDSAPTFVDVDGDGDMDAFIGSSTGIIRYYQNTGTALAPVFAEQTGAANPFNGVDVGYDSAPTFVDVDGDGDMDAFIGAFEGNIRYYQNTGTALAPVFAEQTGAANPFNGVDVGYDSTPTFVDVDGDGDMDAFIGTFEGNIRYYQNTGTALAPVFAEQTGAANPFNSVDVGYDSTPTFVDVDGDGDMDAFIGTKIADIIYYENTHCSFTSEASGPLTAGSVFHFGNGNSRLTVQVNTVGEPPLTDISVACNVGNHPNATANMTAGAYWNITANAGAGSTTPFDLNLTMPFKNPVVGEDKLCRYTGGPGFGWECAQDALTATTITQNNVTALSDWTVGDNVGPTAVTLASLTAHTTAPTGLAALLSAAALALATLWTRRKKQ